MVLFVGMLALFSVLGAVAAALLVTGGLFYMRDKSEVNDDLQDGLVSNVEPSQTSRSSLRQTIGSLEKHEV